MANEEKEIKKTAKKKIVKKNKPREEIKEVKKVEEVKKEETATPEKKSKKKKFYNNKEAIIIMILSLIIGAGVGSIVTRFVTGRKTTKGLEEFDEIYMDIDENKYSRVNKSDMLLSSVEGLLGSLNDKYAYVDKTKNAIMQYEQDVEGEFNGLGIYIYVNDEGKIYIQGVFADSPAEKAGIETGDIIVKLNDKEYDISNYDDFSYNLQTSKKGETVKVEILRGAETLEKEIKLDTIVVESVTYNFIEKDGLRIGVFKITNFANNTYDQFYDLYKKALEDDINSIILDVRCNNEGLMGNAVEVASLFLDKGDILYQTYDYGMYEEVKCKTNKEIDLPVVVLINDGTMSTGEMLASTLNENLGSALVGVKTYGKGYLQKVLPLYNGYAVTYTTEEWVTSKKKKVEEVGITPSIEAKEDEACGADTALEKAIEYLEESNKTI